MELAAEVASRIARQADVPLKVVTEVEDNRARVARILAGRTVVATVPRL